MKNFTDFINKKDKNFEKNSIQENSIQENSIQENSVKQDNQKIKNTEFKKSELKIEKINFIGKIAKIPNNTKPSKSIITLENNNIDKNKLHYIISKQPNNSLVIVKYNEKTKIKMSDFIESLMSHYKKNEKLKKNVEKILIEGNNNFSIIKNIPNINIGEKKLIQFFNDDIIKLLK